MLRGGQGTGLPGELVATDGSGVLRLVGGPQAVWAKGHPAVALIVARMVRATACVGTQGAGLCCSPRQLLSKLNVT